jgi:hypothetical protein
MGIDPIDRDSERLHFADRLEAYTYAALRCHHVLGDPDWVEALAQIGEMADGLNVSDRLVQWFAL